MGRRRPAEPSRGVGAAPVDGEAAWRLVLALRRLADAADPPPARCAFALDDRGWRPDGSGPGAVVLDAARGALLESRPPLEPEAAQLLELHLGHAARGRGRGHVVGILGQSLDGFIATRAGHSRYINGEAALVHLHRLRALSDAVLIGVGTAVADAPRLTTRHVAGPSPVRVVVDPRGRLPADSGLLHDGAARTLVVRRAAGADGEPAERPLTPQATALHLPADARGGGFAPAAVLAALAARGLARVLVEGGGRTVARFLEAGALDRLQLAVAPLILGGGRPALPIVPRARLDEALRPACRRHLLGEDVLFDLRFPRPDGEGGA